MSLTFSRIQWEMRLTTNGHPLISRILSNNETRTVLWNCMYHNGYHK